MKSFRKELFFHLPTRRGLVNITRDVQLAIQESQIKEGIVLVNAMHILKEPLWEEKWFVPLPMENSILVPGNKFSTTKWMANVKKGH